MSYDPLSLCTDAGDHFEVDPAVMFPATLARIQEVLAGEVPTELVASDWKGRPAREPVADKFVRQAEAFPPEAWKLAEMRDFRLDLDPEPRPFAAFRLRASALDFIESWFKRALALKIGKGIRLHISRNADYRRV